MNTSFSATVAAACMGLSSFCLANSLSLNDQMVTATRTALSASEGIASVSVIERADIERLQASSVAELLRRVPGINLSNNGGHGKNEALGIRGTNSNHVLVLIDGIRQGSATTGDVALQNLPVEQIERIEVVRGPRSSLYGSEAIGGVIQIFTRRGQQQGARPWAAATAGSRNYHAGSAGVSGGLGNAWYNLGLSSMGTRGIDARPGAPSPEPDNDGYREWSANLNLGYRFDNGLELDGHVIEVRSHNDYDSGFKANADNLLRTHGLRARFAPTDPWLVTLQAGRSEDKVDTFNGNVFNTRIDTRRDSFSWQNDLRIKPGQVLTLGYDLLQDSVNGTTSFAEDSRNNHGVYAQYLAQLGRHELQLSARHDDNEQHGTYNTGSVGYGYAISDSLRASASFGTAFKAPTFNQLYHPTFGNPDINEETSQGLELGLDGEHLWGSWAVAVYRNKIDDLIAYFNQGNGLRAQNIDKAVITGIELSIASQVLNWDLSSNLTLQDPANKSSRAGQGDLLPRRAEQIFNLDLDRRFGRLAVGGSLHVEGRRWDTAANSTELSGYNTVELRSEYQLSDSWRVQARISNLFDTDYETAATYQQQGRAGYLTLRYQAL
ncbi:MAG: TonB-dependent vitamin B12 receptor [Pseudomonas sp.]